MKKEIIIITDKAHNKPILELLENWGFTWITNEQVGDNIAYIILNKYYVSEMQYDYDINLLFKEPKDATIHLSSDILANPEIVGTFEGAKQMEEPLSNFNKLAKLLQKEVMKHHAYFLNPPNIGIDLANVVNDFYNEICKTYSTPLKPQFQLTRSWIDSKKRYFYNSTSSQNAFTYAIEILAKELGLTIKEDK